MTTTTLYVIDEADDAVAILKGVNLRHRCTEARDRFLGDVDRFGLTNGWAPLPSAIQRWWPAADRGGSRLAVQLCDPNDPPCPRGSGCDYCTA